MRFGLEIPRPRFPEALDSYRELFRVYDCSQAILAEDIEPDARVIPITPRDLSRGLDIWGENGFVTIEGETVYYDSVSYTDIESSRAIEPDEYDGEQQKYYLSRASDDVVSKEVLQDVRLGVESLVRFPEFISENNLSGDEFYESFPTLQIASPYSCLGRVKVIVDEEEGDTEWFYFATKGSGGLVGSSSGAGAGSGIRSITVSRLGITFFGSLRVELAEVTYRYSPKQSEVVATDTLQVYFNGERIIQDGSVVSTELHSFSLEEETGILDIYWNSIDRRSINVEFQRGIIVRLENCIRGYDTESVPHKAGVPVSGYVMAEHHNNLASALMGIEGLIGVNCEDPTSLAGILCQLEALTIEQNPECPGGSLEYEILEEATRERGPLAAITTTSRESTSQRIFFGDGTHTDNASATHQYARGSQFAPSVLFYNDNCEEYIFAPLLGPIPVTTLPSIEIPLIPRIEIPDIQLDLPLDPFDFEDLITFEDLTLTLPSFEGIPSIITLDAPELSYLTYIDLGDQLTPLAFLENMNVEFDTANLFYQGNPLIPANIGFSEISIPTLISISFAGVELPTEITITGMSIPTQIELTGISIPTEIRFTGDGIPSEISVSIAIAVDTSAISGNCFKLVPCTI